MTPLEPIQCAIDLAEAHLQSPITVADMADAAGYSLYHFCRAFGKATRHTPHTYLIRRRMTCAAADLLATEQKIVDIAFAYQFETHEGFIRAFHRMFGTPPTEARNHHVVPFWGCLPRLTEAHLICLEQHDLQPEFASLREQVIPPGQIHPYGRMTSDRGLILPPDETALPSRPVSIAAGACASFHLMHAADVLPLVLDWLMHVWLFYTPHTLRQPYIHYERASSTSITLSVPITDSE